MNILISIVAVLGFSSLAEAYYPTDYSQRLQAVTFGSCNKITKSQEVWNVLGDENSDLFVWMGDAIYANTTDMDEMQRQYTVQKSDPIYSAFAKNTPIVGVWDDHDFGDNNVGSEYPEKVKSQELFLNFMDEPSNSSRRSQKGIYTSYDFGPEGQKVKFIIPDLRYFRDEPGDFGDILGDAQWEWLEKTFAENDADVTFFVSSIQVAASVFFHENWTKFPKSKKKLYKLLNQYNVKNFIILSGDVHYGVMTPVPERHFANYTIWDFTSSGINNSWMPEWRDMTLEKARKSKRFIKDNYGHIAFDWQPGSVDVTITIKNQTGGDELQKTLSLVVD